MKFSSKALLFAAAAWSSAPLLAQTAASHTAHTPTHRAPAASSSAACTKLPDISSKVPTLPAGLPCAKPLYTITTVPTVRIDYVSPMESPSLAADLGIESSSFSLSFIDVKSGTGELVSPHKWLTIHYSGYLTDGTKFDSSVDRGEPLPFPYGGHQVIPGWDTGFDGMRVGGKRRLFIPFQLGYGNQAQSKIPARSMLIFDVELIGISSTAPAPKTPPAPSRPATPPASSPATAPPPGAASPSPSNSTTPPASTTSPTGTASPTRPVTPATDPTKPTTVPPKP